MLLDKHMSAYVKYVKVILYKVCAENMILVV